MSLIRENHIRFTFVLFGIFILSGVAAPLHAKTYTMARLSCEPKDPDGAMQCACNSKLLPSGKYRFVVLNKRMGGIPVGDQGGPALDVTVQDCGRRLLVPWPAGGTLELVATQLKDDIPIRFQGFKKGVGKLPDSDWDFAVIGGSVKSTGTQLATPTRAELNGRVVYSNFKSPIPDIKAQARLTLLNPFDEPIEETLVGDQGSVKVNRKCECAKLKRFKESIGWYRAAWSSNSIYQRIRAGGLANSNPGVPYMDLDGVIRKPPGFADYKAGKISLKDLKNKYGTYQDQIGKYQEQEKDKAQKSKCPKNIFPSGGAYTDAKTCKIHLDAGSLFKAGVPAAGIRTMWMHEEVHQRNCLDMKKNMTANEKLFAKNSPERVRAEELEATEAQLKYMDEWIKKHCK